MAKRGRPSKYSEAITKEICESIAVGESLRSICERPEMPVRQTVITWLGQHKDFLDRYTRAREEQADFYADEIIEIADTEEDVNRAKVRIDARKWKASKMKHRAYGDKVTNEVTGVDGGPVLMWGAGKPKDG